MKYTLFMYISTAVKCLFQMTSIACRFLGLYTKVPDCLHFLHQIHVHITSLSKALWQLAYRYVHYSLWRQAKHPQQVKQTGVDFSLSVHAVMSHLQIMIPCQSVHFDVLASQLDTSQYSPCTSLPWRLICIWWRLIRYHASFRNATIIAGQ